MIFSDSLRKLAHMAPSLVDEKVGIMRWVREVPTEAGAPEFFFCYGQACNTEAFGSYKNFGTVGGAAADRDHALAKALGEGVERYCSAIFDPKELLLTTYNAARFDCVPPEIFALYSQAQYALPDFPYIPFTRDTRVRWMPMRDLVSGQAYHVPAAMVFMPYYPDQEAGESSVIQSISTGLACHTSFEEAAISAICEVIERDAFMITWQAMLSRRLICPESLNAHHKELVARFARTGGRIHLLDLTMDHRIPTVLAVLRHTSPELPALIFAASTALDAGEAITKSLEEAAHTRRMGAHLLETESPLVPTRDFSNVDIQDRHIQLYSQHTHAHLADFIFASNERVDFQDLPSPAGGHPSRDLLALVKALSAVTEHVLLADLTTPDVARLGLAVVRAVLPRFHPLLMGHQQRPLGGERLWQVPQKLGYPPISPESGDNPAPHPYP